MNQYVTGSILKELRENKKLTQQQLADKLYVSDKTISKWETGKGYPDITLLEPLASELGISVIELMAGKSVINTNKSFNMLKTRFWVCPVCGNIICAIGNTVISCCGILLPSLEVETDDNNHEIIIEKSEDEYYVKISHEMTKQHYISFIAAVKDNGYELTKLYPEGEAEARFKIERTQYIYYFCNHHGLFRKKII
ncbi:MAG: helix-turn-helix domain-containing protein [Candidatus Riflebacteria bacterium]|nr:helix-turn-helix domain-containing protein [Candidatus Riflebacteria bacterium]